ncbi:unnamed protein product [Orchesella dallaii]|uniref:Strictosidine synthase conserved region domain-containing protein n=1 Tax=Orchesella dallaii TaxID=48710 RepID=A0ABP1QU15_9HEXA
MGLLYNGFKIGILVFTTVFLAPGLPPHYEFVSFSLEPPLDLEGVLAPNNILDNAKAVKLDSPIAGPESVAIRGDEVFTGLLDGSLVKIKNGKVTKITSLGKGCDEEGVMHCGRIAGVRFDSQGKLLVADAVNGIYSIDADSGKAEKLVGMDVPIEGTLPRFPDDLDIDQNGNIYWSDASTIAGVDQLVLEAFAGPTGRLVKYSTKTKESTVLLSKLHFPNGVQLSLDQQSVLVTETMRARVMRYYIQGKNQGQSDIFVDNLPGLPDNIRPNGRGGYFIVLASPRIPSEFSALDVAGNWPLTRRFIVRLHYFLVKTLEEIEKLLPNIVFKEWIAWIKGFGILGDLEKTPFKTIIIETDKDGKIIGSLQNEKGPITRLSEISVGKEWTYFGSPSLKHLYRMKTSDLKK